MATPCRLAALSTAVRTRRPGARWKAILCIFLAVSAANFCIWRLARNDVLGAAYAIPDGGGYCELSDSGTSETIRYRGSVILPASRGGSYCCGYTFAVVMNVAQRRGLLKGKSVSEIRAFQKEWYGASKKTALKECVAAAEDLGIGSEIDPAQAEAGDFVTFQRKGGPGHSVIFLNWVRNEGGQIVGLRYRSSQPITGGVGDHTEFFEDTNLAVPPAIDRHQLFIMRLDRGGTSRVLHAFE